MDLSIWALSVLAVVIGYLCGSIPFGLLLCKYAGHGDIRKTGSGNIGATNVLRAGSKKLAAATLLLDAGKGALAIAVLYALGGDEDFSYFTAEGTMIIFPWPMALCGLAVILGHMYPVWLKFKGGKGVATFIGMALALHPLVGLAAVVIWLGCAFIFKISSLAALAAVAIAPIAAYFWSVPVSGFGGGADLFAWFYVVFYMFCAALIWWKHRANIKRLMKGEEPKIGKK